MAQFNPVPLPFNPQVPPTGDPTYIGLSKPIDQPDPNRTYEALFKGLGNVVDTAVHGVDFYFKDKIDRELYNKIDVERDQFGVADQTDDARKGRNPLDAPSSILNTPAVEDVRNTLTQAGRLAEAHAAGKLSNTYYASRLESIVRDVRDRYPGYREYIDQKVSQITGMTPANAVRSGILHDLEAASTANKSARDKLYATLEKHADDLGDEFPVVARAVQEGKIDQLGILSRVQPKLATRQKLKDIALNVETNAKVNTLTSSDLTSSATDIAQAVLSKKFGSVQQIFGGPQAIEENLLKAQRGELTLTPDQITQMGGALMAHRSGVENEIRAELYKPGPTSGISIAARINDPAKVEAIVQNTLKRFDPMIEGIKNKDFGLMYANAKNFEMTQDSDAVKMLQNADYRAISVLSKFGPNLLPHFYSRNTEVLDRVSRTAIDYVTKQLAAQPDISEGKTRVPYAGTDALRDLAATRKVDPTGKPIPHSWQTYDNVIKTFEDIANKDLPLKVRENIALGAFSPENRMFISKLDRPSQMSAFARMTSPQVVDAMKEIVKVRPQLLPELKNWVESEFGLTLFRKNIQDLQKVVVDNNSFIVFFNPDTNQIDVAPNPHFEGSKINPFDLRSIVTGGEDSYEKKVVIRNISEINLGLRSMSSVYELYGTKDTLPAYLYQLLSGYGYDANAALAPLTDFGAKLFKTLEAPAIARRKEEEEKRVADEEKQTRQRMKKKPSSGH